MQRECEIVSCNIEMGINCFRISSENEARQK
jgi:hypothetical protein